MQHSLDILDLRPEAPVVSRAESLTRSPARILCVRLASAGKPSVRPDEAADAFLRFSPRLTWREDSSRECAVLLFMDIASTARLFEGEEALLASALDLARKLGFASSSAAISDTPSGAQAFASLQVQTSVSSPVSGSGSVKTSFLPSSPVVCPRGREREYLEPLSLPLLFQLEGLTPWPKESKIEGLVTFFAEVGFRSIGELMRFEAQSMRERWGETGDLVWKRVRALDRPPVSPLAPIQPLQASGHFDFPISLVSLLMHALTPSLEVLFERLQGRGLFAESISLALRGEYSDRIRHIQLDPCAPSRKLDLFLTLLERKLEEEGFFEDPIRSFEALISTRPERDRQLDFFEPRETDTDRLESLISLLKQGSARAGFLRPVPSLLPESAWVREDGGEAVRRELEKESTAEPDARFGVSYELEPASPLQLASSASHNGVPEPVPVRHRPSLSEAPSWGRTDSEEYEDPVHSVRAMPVYGVDVLEAPRPTRLLNTPRPLSETELRSMNFLSANPVERLEHAWWSDDQKRDYFFAVSRQGQCVWLFRELKSRGWFLHGYFD